MPQLHEEKRTELANLVLRVQRKLWHLVAAKKQAINEYDVDIRKLKHLHESLLVKDADSAQLECFEVESVLSPDLEKLLGAR